LSASLEVSYTDKPVSGWRAGGDREVHGWAGGSRTMGAGVGGRTSPNQISVVDTALAFWLQC
jgi:hypothetical protein